MEPSDACFLCIAIYLVVRIYRDVKTMCSTKRVAAKQRNVGAYGKTSPKDAIMKEIKEVYMLPGQKSKVHLEKNCLGKTKTSELLTLEVCKNCQTRHAKTA